MSHSSEPQVTEAAAVIPGRNPSGLAEASHRLLTIQEVAELLHCSWRHALRLVDRRILPRGIKLGALRRWDMAQIQEFIASGCKPRR